MYKFVMAENNIVQAGLPVFWAILGLLVLIALVVGGSTLHNERARFKTMHLQELSRIPDNFSFSDIIEDLKRTGADFYDGELGNYRVSLRKRYMHHGSHRYNELAAH